MPHNLRQCVSSILQQYHNSRGFYYAILCNHWGAIVEDEVAGCTKPIKWQGEVLILKTTPAAAVKLNFQSVQIIQSINQYFGKDLISKIRLQTHG